MRGRFPEPRALYREVCGLLFCRYGVTPTASKLCSLVRKGSMGTPAEVLQAFWQELRGRTRVTIEHPELPDALKQVAAEAIKTIWHAANEAATAELATLRAEARHAASAAETERDGARVETAAAREEAAASALGRGGNHPQYRRGKLSFCISQIVDRIEVVTTCLSYNFGFDALLAQRGSVLSLQMVVLVRFRRRIETLYGRAGKFNVIAGNGTWEHPV